MASRNDSIKLLLLIFLAIICLVALATKAAYWDKVGDKAAVRSADDEVYPGLEGCIAIDSIIIFFLIVGVIFHFVSSLKKFTKFLVILLIVLLIIRIILALLFLAGNNEAVRNTINNCNEIGETECYAGYNNVQICIQTWCGSDEYKNLKGAWGFEIAAFILINILAWVALWLMYKGAS